MVVLRGRSMVAKVAIGKVMTIGGVLDSHLSAYMPGTCAVEAERYAAAYRQAIKNIGAMIVDAKTAGRPEQTAIMEAHQSIMEDPVLEESILGRINQFIPAPQAVGEACEEIAQMFLGLHDPYLRERAADVRDIGNSIIALLLGVVAPKFAESATILCGMDIGPSVIASLPDDKVIGLVLGQGSQTTHAVIMAKARGLVIIVGLAEQLDQLKEGAEIILDGREGTIIVSPTADEFEKFNKLVLEQREHESRYAVSAKSNAITLDGKRIIVAANIGNPQEIEAAVEQGCEGVGLFRTEFLFMGRSSLPSEQEQFEAYKFVAEKCQGQLCIIRTMDIGGDKPLPYLEIPREENPYLGWRAIRISLKRTDLFITQIRAILRASAYGNIAIMLPMVINKSEIIQAKELIKSARVALKSEGHALSESVPLGIMVETPSAAVMAGSFAPECDFFSIGTNDLTQYTLAVDRGNPNVSYLYDHFNPAVLRLIEMTVKAGHEHGIWVGVCGEMAGDELATRLLVSLGVDELSMNAPAIPQVKETIRQSTSDAGLGRRILAEDDVEKIRVYLRF